MASLRALLSRLLGLPDRSRREREFADELDAHLQEHIADNVRRGMSREDARREALVRLGGIAATADRYRDRGGVPALDTLAQDLRFGIRMLVKDPSFTALAVLTLALGIGINTTVFGALYTVLLRPLPFRNADRLVMVWQEYVNRDWGLVNVSYPNFTDLRDQARSFDELAAFSYQEFTVARDDMPERITGLRVSSGLFPGLGVEPFLGRNFLPEEEKPGAARAVLVSHRLWQSRFGSDPALPGSAITLNGERYSVAGVMPPGFQFPPAFTSSVDGVTLSVPAIEFWVPLAAEDFPIRREMRIFMAMGVLKDGISIEQAQVEADAIARNLAQAYPGPNTDLGFRLIPLHQQVVGEMRFALLVLFGAVSFVTLIACANVANLLLARAAGRQREMAVRAALGAGRLRLVRQLLVESWCLAVAGGIVGLLFARWAADLFVAFSPPAFPRLDEIGIYRQVLAFNVGVSLLTGMIFGLAPAWHASKPDLNHALKEESAGSSGGLGRQRAARALVVVELALCVVLLAGAGLTLKSLLRLADVNPGFDTERLLILQLFVPPSVAREEQPRVALHQRLIQQLESLPGVEAAATVSLAPLSSRGEGSVGVEPEGSGPSARGENLQVSRRPVSTSYFRTMGIPLRGGRVFDDRDGLDAPSVAIINETMARRLWPGENAVNKRLKIDGEGDSWVLVVGVAGDVRQYGIDMAPMPEMYVPYLQNPGRGVTVMVRTATDPMSMAATVRAEIGRVHPDLPVSQIREMTAAVSASLARPRLNTYLLALFAGVALVLAAVGVYGMVSYSVAQRTREVGIRMALGAQPRDIFALMMKQGLLLISIGIGTGLGAAVLLTRLAASLLYEVSATDPATFLLVAVLLATVALVAGYVPARRATMVDPIVALRYE
jgi:putative ABC transport system permease protein